MKHQNDLLSPESPAAADAVRRRLLVAAALAAGGCASRPDAPARNLDVIFVPTPMEVVDVMLDMARVTEKDRVYDLGCGDGRIVIRAAERFGCTGVGVDLDPRRVGEARANARKAGPAVEARVRFEVGDVFTFDFSQATVVTMYLLPSINLKLRPRLVRELPAGTRIVSHDFDMGDWQPLQSRTVERSRVFVWEVPRDPPAYLLGTPARR
jgi:SAM-dependent methyltransferase